MSQQHAQYEEFHDGPQPTSTYQDGYSGPQPVSYTMNVPPAPTYVAVPGQKLIAQDVYGRGLSAGQRLGLAIVSVVFTFAMFIVTLAIAVAGATGEHLFTVVPIALVFALGFAIVVVFLNLIFNRKN